MRKYLIAGTWLRLGKYPFFSENIWAVKPSIILPFQYFLILFFAYKAFPSFSQNQELRFKHYTVNNGLTQNNVNEIIQDAQGFIWIATDDGLNQFDGYQFRAFRHKQRDENSLPNNRVQSIFEDKEGLIWIGCHGGGLSYFDKKQQLVKRFDLPDANKGIINSFAQKGDQIWIGVEFSGVYCFDKSTSKIRQFAYHAESENGLPGDRVKEIIVTQNDEIWVCTASGLSRFNEKDETFSPVASESNGPKGLLSGPLTTLYQSKNGEIWIGYASGGISRYKPTANQFKHFPNLSAGTIGCFADGPEGTMWIGSQNGFFIIDTNTWQIKTYQTSSENQLDLAGNDIRSIFRDMQGGIWMSAYSGGLSYFHETENNFQHFYHKPGSKNSLTDNAVLAFSPDNEGNILIGTDGGGLNIFNRKRKSFSTFPFMPDGTGLNSNTILCLFEDAQQNLWAGTYLNGLNMLDRETGKVQYFLHDPENPNSLSENAVFALHDDQEGNLWIGTNGGGAAVYHHKSGQFKTHRLHPHPDSLKIDFIRVIYRTSDGEMIIGGYGGLSIYNPETKKFRSFAHDSKDSLSLASNEVRTVFQDSKGSIWVGTHMGLCLFDAEKENFKTYDGADGLPNEVIYAILEDNQHFIWVSTNKGLSKLNPETMEFKNFDVRDGLQGNEFNGGSACKLKDGSLLFGGTQGFNIFHPEKVKINKIPPKVLLSRFKIFNETVPIGQKNSPINQHISFTKELVLSHEHSVFTLEFVALNYTRSEKNQYAYKLEGLEENWNYVGNQQTATYTNLDDGQYIFRVKAANNDGFWNENGVSLKITILPPWWETLWFRSLITFILVGTGAGLYKMRTYQLKKRQRILEKTVEDRTMALKDKNVQLSEQNELVLQQQEEILQQNYVLKEQKNEIESIATELEKSTRLRIKFFMNISHEFRTPLTLVLGPLENLMSRVKDKKVLNELSVIQRNANHLLGLINQLLDLRKIETQTFKLHVARGNLKEFLMKVFANFQSMAQRNNIDFKFEFDMTSEDDFWFDANVLEKVIINLLSNAFKYTPKEGSICLKAEISRKKEEVKISVIDNGVGIPEADCPYIFDRFYRIEKMAYRDKSGSGIGLALCQELVALHKGKIHVFSKEGSGSNFHFTIPLSAKVYEPSEKADHLKSVASFELLENEKENLNSSNGVASVEMVKEALPVLLVVEDNLDLHHYLTDNLKENFNILSAENGKKGLSLAFQKLPDLILSDIMMPEMDGITFCKEIKTNEKTSHIPVILLTAKSEEVDQVNGLETGADDYILKPFNLNILKAKIHSVIQNRQKLQSRFNGAIHHQLVDFGTNTTEKVFLAKLFKVIDENLSNEDFGNLELCEALAMSKSQLYRKIKAVTGKTVHEVIRNYKLTKAGELLKNTNMTVSEITSFLGFKYLSSFSKAFKAHYGYSPKEFQDMI